MGVICPFSFNFAALLEKHQVLVLRKKLQQILSGTGFVITISVRFMANFWWSRGYFYTRSREHGTRIFKTTNLKTAKIDFFGFLLEKGMKLYHKFKDVMVYCVLG